MAQLQNMLQGVYFFTSNTGTAVTQFWFNIHDMCCLPGLTISRPTGSSPASPFIISSSVSIDKWLMRLHTDKQPY